LGCFPWRIASLLLIWLRLGGGSTTVNLLCTSVQAPLIFSLAFACYGALCAFIWVAGKICVLRVRHNWIH
jgi:uncharacterized integral membrane protein